LKFSDREEGEVTIVEPQGKIMGGPDASLLHERFHELIDQGKKKVVVDLFKVNWMNSSGLGILISSLITLRNKGGNLKLARVPERITNLLQVTKLITVFQTYETVEEAIKSYV
jgi:anti-sigma B factor antagonist